MAFVHGLVKAEPKGRNGWVAPIEMGEAAPHYVSFLIPVVGAAFLDIYTCEVVSSANGDKTTAAHDLVREGDDSFVLHLPQGDIWFNVRAMPKDELRLPYVGRLTHQDFSCKLTEIEPENPEILDQLFEKHRVFVIGCDPFEHYAGVG